MSRLTNIYRCKECGFHVIAEENDIHQCRELKDVKLEDDREWVFDGKMWYPLKQPNFNNRRKRPLNRQNRILGFVFH